MLTPLRPLANCRSIFGNWACDDVGRRPQIRRSVGNSARLVVRDGIELAPQLLGGFQQAGTRPGTESVALAVGMRTALELWHEHRQEWSAASLSCAIEFEGDSLPRRRTHNLPTRRNRQSLATPAYHLEHRLRRPRSAAGFSRARPGRCRLFNGLRVCEWLQRTVANSHRDGLDPAVISSALRFSFGVTTTADEVEEAASRILKVCNGLRR